MSLPSCTSPFFRGSCTSKDDTMSGSLSHKPAMPADIDMLHNTLLLLFDISLFHPTSLEFFLLSL